MRPLLAIGILTATLSAAALFAPLPASAGLTGCSLTSISPLTFTGSNSPTTSTQLAMNPTVTCTWTASSPAQTATISGYFTNGGSGNRTATSGVHTMAYTITAGPVNPLDSTHPITGTCTIAANATSCTMVFSAGPMLGIPAPLAYNVGTYTDTIDFIVTMTSGSISATIK